MQFSSETKKEVIDKIKNKGVRVVDVCHEYNVSAKTVYCWLRGEAVGGERNLMIENIRLKKELDMAYRMLGKATALIERPKK